MSNRLLSKFCVFSFLQAILFFTVIPSAVCFETFTHSKGPKQTCQTSCHQPENIIKIKKNKFQSAACKQCHVGKKNPVKLSPFKPSLRNRPPIKNDPISNKTFRNLKTSSQPIFKLAKKDNTKLQSGVPMNMAFIPKGEFIMGSNDRWDDESPEFMAATNAYLIDLFEVTNKDYKKYVNATNSEPPYHWPNGKIPKMKENHPVIYVNWFDASNYCKWSGKRLPTEKEWEKAARGENGLIYPWGNEWSLEKSNNPYKESTGTKPVGSYPNGLSPYGIYDMSGNVWEWVDSFYLPHEGNTIPRPEYGNRNRVLKGGSWFDCLSYGCGLSAPTFNRSFFTPEVRNNSFGFRCAKNPAEKVAKLSSKP